MRLAWRAAQIRNLTIFHDARKEGGPRLRPNALIKLDAAGIDILLPIHDEVLLQSPEAEAEETAIEVARIMIVEAASGVLQNLLVTVILPFA